MKSMHTMILFHLILSSAHLFAGSAEEDWQRTVILIYGETQSGQEMFIRGGVDPTIAKNIDGRDCSQNRDLCSLPIQYNNLKNNANGWKDGDTLLDWYGPEANQPSDAMGTKPDWTTDLWPSDWGEKKTFLNDGFGEAILNTYGPHYWLLDIQMDCSRALDFSGSKWFEFKTFVSNPDTWEGDINQPNTPYASRNHLAQCGKINVFKRNQDEPVDIKAFDNQLPSGNTKVISIYFEKPTDWDQALITYDLESDGTIEDQNFPMELFRDNWYRFVAKIDPTKQLSFSLSDGRLDFTLPANGQYSTDSSIWVFPSGEATSANPENRYDCSGAELKNININFEKPSSWGDRKDIPYIRINRDVNGVVRDNNWINQQQKAPPGDMSWYYKNSLGKHWYSIQVPNTRCLQFYFFQDNQEIIKNPEGENFFADKDIWVLSDGTIKYRDPIYSYTGLNIYFKKPSHWGNARVRYKRLWEADPMVGDMFEYRGPEDYERDPYMIEKDRQTHAQEGWKQYTARNPGSLSFYIFDESDPKNRIFGPFVADQDVYITDLGSLSKIDPSNSNPSIRLFPASKIGDNGFYEDELTVSVDIFTAGDWTPSKATYEILKNGDLVDRGTIQEFPDKIDLEILLGNTSNYDRNKQYAALLDIGDYITVNLSVEDTYLGKTRTATRSGTYERVAPGKGMTIHFEKPALWEDVLLWYDRNSDGLWETSGDPVLFTEAQKASARMSPNPDFPGWFSKPVSGADKVTFLFNDGTWENRVKNNSPDSDGNFYHSRLSADSGKNGEDIYISSTGLISYDAPNVVRPEILVSPAGGSFQTSNFSPEIKIDNLSSRSQVSYKVLYDSSDRALDCLASDDGIPAISISSQVANGKTYRLPALERKQGADGYLTSKLCVVVKARGVSPVVKNTSFQPIEAPLQDPRYDNETMLQGFYWYIPNPQSQDEVSGNEPTPESDLWHYIATQGAKRFYDDGFTHVWLPPAQKSYNAPDPNVQGFNYNTGYAVYDRYDLGEFHQMGSRRTKYGSKSQLQLAVRELQQFGIKAIADIVMNQMMGSDTPRLAPIMPNTSFRDDGWFFGADSTIAFTDFNFSNQSDLDPRNGKYSSFTWNICHFNGMEDNGFYYLFDRRDLCGKQPSYVGHSTPVNKIIRWEGDPSPTQSLGDRESAIYEEIRSEAILGLDIDYRDQDIRRETTQWTKWLVDTIGFDGFRVDAIKHMDIEFIHDWSREMTQYMHDKHDKVDQRYLIFGESWDGWDDRLAAFFKGSPNGNVTVPKTGPTEDSGGIRGSMGLFDVPLHYHFQKVAGYNSVFANIKDLGTTLKGVNRAASVSDNNAKNHNPLLVSADFYRANRHVVTFVDNHDTVWGQKLESYIPIHTKLQAYTYILMSSLGTPMVYYRDIYKGSARPLETICRETAFGRVPSGDNPGQYRYEWDFDLRKREGVCYLIKNATADLEEKRTAVPIQYDQNEFATVLNHELTKLIRIRKFHAYGGERFYTGQNSHVLGYRRYGDSRRDGLVYVIGQAVDSPARMNDQGVVIEESPLPVSNESYIDFEDMGNMSEYQLVAGCGKKDGNRITLLDGTQDWHRNYCPNIIDERGYKYRFAVFAKNPLSESN